MTPLDQFRDLLEAILKEWNQAEEDLKIAELVNNQVITPAIKELRYAGRRIVDALVKVLAGGNPQDIRALLEDAKFDCHRARHDAIDATVSKISIDLEIMVRELKYDPILKAYPEFPQLLSAVQGIEDKITASRANRENREAIYQTIVASDFPALVKRYRDLIACEPIMKELAKENRKAVFYGKGGYYVGIFAIILTIIIALLSN